MPAPVLTTFPDDPAYWAERESVGMARLLVLILGEMVGVDMTITYPNDWLPMVWVQCERNPRWRAHLLEVARGVQRPAWAADDSRAYALLDWIELPGSVRARLVVQIPKAAKRATELMAYDAAEQVAVAVAA